MILAYKDIVAFLPVTIDGVVVHAATNKPISGLHVFTKKGEEEAFTNSKGVFHFTSWQALPLIITIQQPGGVKKTIRVTGTPVKLHIEFP